MNKPLVSIVIITRNRKEDLKRCLDSIVRQSYNLREIIVVDNGSEIPVSHWIKKEYHKVIVITSEKNLGGAGGRNLGIKYAKGKYILFIDDDAYADKALVEELLTVLKGKEVGVVQPKIYDSEQKDVLQGIGHGFNFFTGRVYGIGIREKDKGQFEKVIEIPMAGCTWMVKRSLIEKIGNYDEDLFIPYEDTDFSFRAHKAGYKVLYVPKGKVWHRGLKNTMNNQKLQYIGITSPDKAYRISRNKLIFMKKHAPFINLIIFLLIFFPIYSLIHTLIIITSGRFNILRSYWKGLFSGLYYVSTK
jgi:GT2 family glycosyltransferase